MRSLSISTIGEVGVDHGVEQQVREVIRARLACAPTAVANGGAHRIERVALDALLERDHRALAEEDADLLVGQLPPTTRSMCRIKK